MLQVGADKTGSNLCEAILNLGYRVRCLDDFSTDKQANVDLFINHSNYSFIKGNIKDLDTCIEACEGVDFVLNQAAWGSVPRSIEMPLFCCLNNIQGTLNMMEAVRQNMVKKFVYASCSSVYGDEAHLPKQEEVEVSFPSPQHSPNVAMKNGQSKTLVTMVLTILSHICVLRCYLGRMVCHSSTDYCN